MTEIKKPYDYTIYPENSPRIFKELCYELEQKIPEIKRGRLLIDVDGSTIQLFYVVDRFGTKEISVFDDYDVGAVFIKSQYDLDDFVKSFLTRR